MHEDVTRSIDALTYKARKHYRLNPDETEDLRQNLWVRALEVEQALPEDLPCTPQGRIISRLNYDLSRVMARGKLRRPFAPIEAATEEDLIDKNAGIVYDGEEGVRAMLETYSGADKAFLGDVVARKLRDPNPRSVNLQKLARVHGVEHYLAVPLWREFLERVVDGLCISQ